MATNKNNTSSAQAETAVTTTITTDTPTKGIADENKTSVQDADHREFEELKKKNEALERQMQELLALLKNNTQTAQTPVVNVIAPSTDVVLVYCSDSMGYLKTAHVELRFNRWGEEFTLTRSQFDEVVGSYRSWFDQGILTVSGDTEEGIKLAAAKGIKTSREVYLDAHKLESIGTMSLNKVEDLWNSCPMEEQKNSIVTFIKRKFIEGDKAYMTRGLIDLMNRLTDGGFRREQDELDGRLVYEPLQFNKKHR